MKNIERVRRAMAENAGRMTISQIVADTKLNRPQVYSSMTILREKKIAKASEFVSYGAHGAGEKTYWLAELESELEEYRAPVVQNVPLVAYALRNIGRHVGNPFAGLMA